MTIAGFLGIGITRPVLIFIMVLILWLLLYGGVTFGSVLGGLAVAAAVTAWVPLGDL